MSYYYDTITDPSIFLQRAGDHANFDSLSQTDGFQSDTGNWDIRYFFANRVICTPPEPYLLFLKEFFPSHEDEPHQCLRDLQEGPDFESSDLYLESDEPIDITHLSEPQLVQAFQPDSLGYVWAALAPFMKAEGESLSHDGKSSLPVTNPINIERNKLERAPAAQQTPVKDEKRHLSASLPDDAAIRLASRLLRCVVNYAQPLDYSKTADQSGPFVVFRGDRLTHRYETGQHNVTVEAIDDGGLQIVDSSGRLFQVAMLEGKRAFQVVVDGVPEVTDELLAQLVGEAIALSQSKTNVPISTE